MPEDPSSTTGAVVSCPSSEAVNASAHSTTATTTTTTSVVPSQCLTPTTVHVNQAQQCAITMPLVSCQLPLQTAATQVQVAPPASTVVRASLPHVQVIHQPIHSPSFLQQHHYMVQQQFMFQNAVQAAMQAQGISPQLTLTPVGPNKPVSIGPVSNVTLQSALPQVTQAQMKSMVVAQSGSAASQTAKPMGSKAATVIPQQQTVIPQQQTVIPQQQTVIPQQQMVIPQQQTAAAMFAGQKPLLQRQPVVIGQLGVLPTQASQTLVGQPKSPIVGQTNQMLKSQPQIRFSNQPTLVTNTAQLISGNHQAMLNHFQAIASLQQQQAGTILSTQPLYIRTTGPILQPQTVIGNVQAVAPTLGKAGGDVRGQLRTVAPGQGVKAVPNILPHIARATTPMQTSQRMLSVAPATQGGATSKGVQTSHAKQIAKMRTPKSQASKTTATVRNAAQQQHHSWSGAAGGGQPPTAKVQPKPVQMKKNDAAKGDSKVNGAPATQKASTSMLVAPSPSPVANSSIVQVLCHANGKAADKLVVASTAAKTVIPAIGTAAEQTKSSQSTGAVATVTTGGGKKQQAIVKPHILTHVIEGFIIQEAAEPFPVERSSLLTDYVTTCQPASSGGERSVEPVSLVPTQGGSTAPQTVSIVPKMRPSRSKSQCRRYRQGGSGSMTKLKCEFCGKIDFAYKFRRSKRFCSMACAKRYNVGCSRRMALFPTPCGSRYMRKKHSHLKRIWKQSGGRISSGPLQRSDAAFVDGDEHPDINIDAAATSAPSVPESSTESSEPSGSCSGQDESSSPRSPPELERVTDMEVEEGEEVAPSGRKHPSQWTVSEVLQFIQDLPGCCVYADEFSRQEIDGQALMLLKEDHLMTTMNIKLGPALKICARINTLKDELS